MSEKETETKKDFKDNLQLVTLQIELAKPFVDFIEQYRQYFGSQYTTELICMQMIYSQIKRLYNELSDFAAKKGNFLDSSDFYKKHLYLSMVSWEEPEDEETE